MSTLVTQTISNGTVSTSSANVIQGSAKAWVNFTATATPTINASYNVSSITYNATASFTVNFTNAFADANYTVASTGANAGGNRAVTFYRNTTLTTTASACPMFYYDTASGQYNSGLSCYATFFR
jgi:hypothetical protein